MRPDDNHLIFRIVDFGLKQQWFTFNQLADGLQLDKTSRSYVWNSLVSQQPHTANPNHLMALVEPNKEPDQKNYVYGLLPNAIIQYVDYLEIVEARKMAAQAHRNSNVALTFTVYAILISVVLGLGQLFFQLAQAWNSQ